ncbi:uncharacterized protein LOC143343428 [Colletes latitarsis]|uniref:uncharacterized protein LOC143343428 n=1 Tax=Colletes latitarsis TaxID=2605962 RepID=UPI004035684C
MRSLILVCCITVVTLGSENDEWVWKGNAQNSRLEIGSYRYQVNENLEDLDNSRPFTGFRPQNPGPYGPYSRPIVPATYPGNKEVLVGPGGPTAIVKRPPYNGGIDDGALNVGYVPPWIKNDPRYQEYDVCRCRYSFDCPSFGLQFGSCSKSKNYCCFSSKKYPALVLRPPGVERLPSYQSPSNKYGPATLTQSPNYNGNRRPQVSFNAGNYYFLGENVNFYPKPNSNPYQRPNGNPYRRPHSKPYDQSYDYDQNYDYDDFDDVYGRSSRKNQTETESNSS